MGRLSLLVAALWWGSLSTIGFGVVPLLFAHLPTPAMAGTMAARLFTAQTWVSAICALLLLLFSVREQKMKENQPAAPVLLGPSAMIFIVSGMLLALLSEFAVAPHIVARESLRLWHSVGSAMYVAQWACALALLARLAGRLNLP